MMILVMMMAMMMVTKMIMIMMVVHGDGDEDDGDGDGAYDGGSDDDESDDDDGDDGIFYTCMRSVYGAQNSIPPTDAITPSPSPSSWPDVSGLMQPLFFW